MGVSKRKQEKPKFRVGQIVGLFCTVCPVHCCGHVTTFRQVKEVKRINGTWNYVLAGLQMLREENQLRALNNRERGR